jgi:pyrroline-5-carboxylate reductase
MQGTLGFIGAGNMARGLIGGLCARGLPSARIHVSDPVPEQLAAIARDFGVRTSPDNDTVASDADVLVLAVKPQYMRAVVEGLRSTVSAHRPLIVSVAAGIRIAALTNWFDGYERLVRAMPNRPALLGAGVSALFAGDVVASADRGQAEELLRAVGTTIWVPRESDLDIVTAVSGSGPAYFFLLIELLERAAEELGLSSESARTLAIETAYGASLMARQRQYSPEELRVQVTSRGGTTAAALAVLESADVRGIVRRAVMAACQRSAELAAEFGS